MPNQAYNLPFAAIGADVMIWETAKIVSPETITLGDSIIIDSFSFFAGGQKSTLGSFIHIAPYALIVGGGELVLEDFVGISAGVRVYTGNDDYLGGSLTGPTIPPPYRQPIRSFIHIGKHSVIGANSVVLPGVTIGEEVAVGANSLVTKDLEPWTIYVGSPVRPLRERPRQKMLELEAQLRADLYDAQGRYIPKAERPS